MGENDLKEYEFSGCGYDDTTVCSPLTNLSIPDFAVSAGNAP
jgi:aminopeptidase-like protein